MFRNGQFFSRLAKEIFSSILGGTATLFDHLVTVPTDIVAQHMMIYKNAENFTNPKSQAVIKFLKLDNLTHHRTLGFRVIRAIWKVDGWRGFYRSTISQKLP